jgi:hypothetical protein
MAASFSAISLDREAIDSVSFDVVDVAASRREFTLLSLPSFSAFAFFD